MTSPTTPASPTSADIGFPASGSQSPSPVARGEWPREWIDAVTDSANLFGKAHSVLNALASVGALRPPSPPAVVGKPTKEALARAMLPLKIITTQPEAAWRDWEDELLRDADIILAAPIWPTAEPPATVDDGSEWDELTHELRPYMKHEGSEHFPAKRLQDLGYTRQRAGSGVTREAVFAVIDQRIETAPFDGINAEGVFNEHVADCQGSYIKGMRAARLAVMALITGKG